MFYFNQQKETFITNKFDIYVISLKNKDRLKNIKEQENKLGVSVEIFDAVKVDDLNLDEFVNNGMLLSKNYFNEKVKQKKREVGCYLSHYYIYKKIKSNDKYTIIFEDDFVIKVDDFIDKVNIAINKINEKNIDFDILFLGNHSHNENHGTPVIDDIYKSGNEEDLVEHKDMLYVIKI